MKSIKHRLLSLLLTLVTILSLLPTAAFAASHSGSGLKITTNQAYWSTRLLANGTPYSYRPPLVDGKLVYCMDSGLGYHYATPSYLNSFTWTSGTGADADAVLQSAVTNSGLSEMDAATVENVKWMMTYLNDCKASNVGQLFMAVQTYVWDHQSYKGEPGGDGDAGGYTVREIKAPANYSINPTVMTAYLEFNGQIVTFEVQNTSVSTGVSIKKTGPVQAVPGQPIRYVFSQIKNGSNVSLDSFYWRDQIPAQITLNKLVTGSYNQQQNYKVVYKTNLSEDYRTLADNLSTSKVYVLDARPAVLGLAANERVTEIMFVFGNVRAGFAQVETPCIYATARSGLANNSSIVNVADVGGLYNGQWIQAVSRWLTTVYTKTTVRLPKTGY